MFHIKAEAAQAAMEAVIAYLRFSLRPVKTP